MKAIRSGTRSRSIPGAALLAIMAALVSLALGAANRTSRMHALLAHAPEAARQRANPYEGRPEAIEAGRKLYARYCARCHGDSAGGTHRGPGLRSPAVRDALPGELAWFLEQGIPRKGMPSWSRLPEQRRFQIVSFLESLP
jgi:mono/diheme cytochrome c family protein